MRRDDELRAFLHLSETLRFSTTARELHLGPSALTRMVQRLEEEAGARLLERDRRRVALTPAGERFRAYAAEAVNSWDALQRDLRADEAPVSGVLRMYCSVTASQSIVPDLLARFRTAHPAVRIQLDTGYASNALELVRDGIVDVAIAALPERIPASVAAVEITTTPVVLVAPRARSQMTVLLERRPVPWAEVPMVLPSHGLARRHADRWFRSQGLRAEVAAEVEGHEAILSLVALGVGVGVLPLLVVEKSALAGDVTVLDVRPRLPAFRIGACVRARDLDDPVVAALWASLD